MTVGEAAEALRVSVITIRRWLASGKLKARRAGRKLLIDPAEIQGLLKPNYVIARGSPLLPGMTAALTDAELAPMGERLLSVLQAGGWPIDLLPITADALRPVLLDQTQPGPLFWRTLMRGIHTLQEPLREMTLKERRRLSAEFDAWRAGKGAHPFRGEEK